MVISIKIALCTNRFKTGGIETHIQNLINGLDSYEFTLVLDQGPSQLYTSARHISLLRSEFHEPINETNREIIDGKKIVRIGPPDILYTSIFRRLPIDLSYSINAPIALIRHINLCNHLKNVDYDIAHFHMFDISRFYIAWKGYNEFFLNSIKSIYKSIANRIPLLFTDHSYLSRSQIYPRLSHNDYDWREYMLEIFPNIICVELDSYAYLRSLQKKHGMKKGIYYVPNSINSNVFPYSEQIFDDKLVVGYVARFGREGENFLMEFIKKLPDFINLHIAGEGDLDDIETYEQKFQHPRISFYSNLTISEMPKFYQDINILLNPLPSPGIGRNSLESLSCGKPVIMIGNHNRYPIVNGKTGFIISNDVEVLNTLLKTINNNRRMLNTLGKNAREVIMNEYCNNIIFEKYKEIYEELVP